MKILVLSGGVSRERDVSLRSGRAVAMACRELGYQVTEGDVGPNDLSALKYDCDVVFPVLHGCFGEDGELQAILEAKGKRFVGSDSKASKLAFDKAETKRIWMNADLPTPRYRVFRSVPDLNELNGFQRVFCKPNQDGSSFGVKYARSPADALQQIGTLLPEHHEVLVEEYIEGRELTVGIIDGKPLPVIEILSEAKFFDFDAKYNRTDTRYDVPARLAKSESESIQQQAIEAYNHLGCEHLARVDLMFHPTRGPFFLEINTLPGFTSSSLLPKAAAAGGLSFNALVDHLIKLAYRSSR